MTPEEALAELKKMFDSSKFLNMPLPPPLPVPVTDPDIIAKWNALPTHAEVNENLGKGLPSMDIALTDLPFQRVLKNVGIKLIPYTKIPVDLLRKTTLSVIDAKNADKVYGYYTNGTLNIKTDENGKTNLHVYCHELIHGVDDYMHGLKANVIDLISSEFVANMGARVLLQRLGKYTPRDKHFSHWYAMSYHRNAMEGVMHGSLKGYPLTLAGGVLSQKTRIKSVLKFIILNDSMDKVKIFA